MEDEKRRNNESNSQKPPYPTIMSNVKINEISGEETLFH